MQLEILRVQTLSLRKHSSYGQLEWELDQRLLGLGLKSWPGHPVLCERVSHPPSAAFDRARWRYDTEAAANDTAAGKAALGKGEDRTEAHLWAHLPAPAPGGGNSGSSSRRGSDVQGGAVAGYSEAGWQMVERALARLTMALGLDTAAAAAMHTWATTYRTAYAAVASGPTPVRGGVVVSAAVSGDMLAINDLAAGLYAQVIIRTQYSSV